MRPEDPLEARVLAVPLLDEPDPFETPVRVLVPVDWPRLVYPDPFTACPLGRVAPRTITYGPLPQYPYPPP